MKGEKHRPRPDHVPAPVLCLDCRQELKPVYDPRKRKRYWRHKRAK